MPEAQVWAMFAAAALAGNASKAGDAARKADDMVQMMRERYPDSVYAPRDDTDKFND